MSPLAAAGVAILGALGVEFVFYLNPHRFQGWPPYARRLSYWIMVMIGAGFAAGIAVAAASEGNLRWYAALNIGAAWPVILQQGSEIAPVPTARDVN